MASQNRKLKVFLCHSKDDKPKVRKLYKRLITDGFDVWLDEEKLLPGQDWDLEIQKSVRNSDTVVVCLSKGSITKEGYIQKEIRLALDTADEKPEGTIYFIPARLEDCSIPTKIGRYQYVDLYKKSGYLRLREALNLRMEDLRIRFDSTEVLPSTNEDLARIPILGPITAGFPLPDFQTGTTILAENETNAIEIARSLLPNEKGHHLYALEIHGDSMIDAEINDGDIVVMRPATTARNGEMVAVWLPNENSATLKYFFKEKDGFRLQPANPTMKPIFVNKNEPLEIKGKVVMVIRQVAGN